MEKMNEAESAKILHSLMELAEKLEGGLEDVTSHNLLVHSDGCTIILFGTAPTGQVFTAQCSIPWIELRDTKQDLEWFLSAYLDTCHQQLVRGLRAIA